MSDVFGLSHLFMTVFFNSFANAVVIPAVVDVTMAAVCPGKDECSLAIYLNGAQLAIIGLGSVVVMPMIGKLSDTYGRKAILTLPMILTIFPPAILACNTKKYYFYAYYVLKTVIGAIEGSVQFLAFAYVADSVEERKRASLFVIMSGLMSFSFVLGNATARILSASAIFQVAVVVSSIALLYMMVFLRESILQNNISLNSTESDCLLHKNQPKTSKFFKILDDTISMLRSSPAFSKTAIVAFLSTTVDVGVMTSLLYYLKARFQFNKNQFADQMVITGIAGSISQLVLMPILTPLLGEENMLSIGLFFSCAQMTLISFAWSSWVPYAALMICIVSIFSQPCIRVIASKHAHPSEQGKALGCITGVCSFASIASPFVFTPLTALFLSDNAPFYFPGFSFLCYSFVAMIGLSQSIALKKLPSPPLDITTTTPHAETLV